MVKWREEMDFQLELLRVQVEHQDILSILSLFIATLFSAMVSLLTTYLGFFVWSGNLNFAYMVLAIAVIFPIAMFSLVLLIRGPVATALRKNLQKELNKIREKFSKKKPAEKEEAKRNETKEKKENEKRESMSKFEKFVVFFTALTLICNIILFGFNLHLVGQTNQIYRENLEYQSMMYNFTSVITARTDNTFLESSSYSYHNDTIFSITNYGYLQADLDVITPHYGVISITLKKFNLGDNSIVSSENRNNTKVSYAYEHDEYEYPVVSGLNHIDAQIHLKALVYPNPQNLPPKGESVQFVLGLLFLEAELFDIQTQGKMTKEFSSRIVVLIEVPL